MEELLVVAICLLLNGMLAAFEMAFVCVPRGQLRRASRNGSIAAGWLLARREQPERTLSIIQIGITLVGIVAAAVGGIGATESIQPYFVQQGMGEVTAEVLAVLLVVVPLTFLSVVIGELGPKSIALRAPLAIALRGAQWIVWADRALAPVVSALEWATRILLKLFFGKTRPHHHPQDTVELDALAPAHQEAVVNFAHIEGRHVKDIMVRWRDVTCVRRGDPMEDVVQVVFASGHTRLPVLDDGDVRGVLHTKEFLAFRENGGRDWNSIIRPVICVAAATPALSVLRIMQSKRSHMAIVYSASGKRLGIVTLEDIIEEFLGDIFDEDEDSRIRQVFAERVKSRGLARGA